MCQLTISRGHRHTVIVYTDTVRGYSKRAPSRLNRRYRDARTAPLLYRPSPSRENSTVVSR